MVKGEIPYHKVYEDELTIAFLDYQPLTKGHLLVIPKEQIDHLDECSPELYTAIFSTVHKMSVQIKIALQPLRIALIVHGFEVPHAHVHVVPVYTGDELHVAAKERGNLDSEMARSLVATLTS